MPGHYPEQWRLDGLLGECALVLYAHCCAKKEKWCFLQNFRSKRVPFLVVQTVFWSCRPLKCFQMTQKKLCALKNFVILTLTTFAVNLHLMKINLGRNKYYPLKQHHSSLDFSISHIFQSDWTHRQQKQLETSSKFTKFQWLETKRLCTVRVKGGFYFVG